MTSIDLYSFNVPIIVSTITIFLFTKIVPKLSEMISKRFFQPERKELENLAQISEIKKQLNRMSQLDEFARYSKLQRKLNLLTLDVDSTAGFRQSSQNKLASIIKFASYILAGLCNIIIFYKYSQSPVFILPTDWFYPLNPIFAFPTGIPGAISLPFWLLFVKNSIDSLY